jgi:hypothetical protein
MSASISYASIKILRRGFLCNIILLRVLNYLHWQQYVVQSGSQIILFNRLEALSNADLCAASYYTSRVSIISIFRSASPDFFRYVLLGLYQFRAMLVMAPVVMTVQTPAGG